MKNIISLLVLICSVAVIIVSCAKKDDSTTATAAAGNTAGTGTTASGTITGNDNLTGVFHSSWYGQEPSGGCIDNSSAITAHSYNPSDTLGFKRMWIITGASTYTDSIATYSDATCSTITSYFNKLYDNVTIGSGLTGLTAGSSPAKPTTANKISYIDEKYSLMANTTASIAKHHSAYSATVTSGTEMNVDESSPSTEYNLIATGTVSGSTYLFLGSGSSSDNKTDWGSSNTYWK